MAKYMVMGEISLMSAALRRGFRFSHHNEHLEELIRNFSSLKDILSRQSDLSDSEPSVYFSPFLDVVRSEDTNGTITAMALTALAKFLQYGLIDPRLESAATTAEHIVLAMKKMSYITDDVASDEIVLMKFLHVIRSLLMSQVGCLLSNSGVCELIQAIIKIIFDPGFGVLLKKMAEQTWGEVVQLLFARLPQFSEDVEDFQLKQLKIRGTIDHRSQKRRNVHQKSNKTIPKEEMPFSIGAIGEQLPSDSYVPSESAAELATANDSQFNQEQLSLPVASSFVEQSAQSKIDTIDMKDQIESDQKVNTTNGINVELELMAEHQQTISSGQEQFGGSVEIVNYSDQVDGETTHVVHLCGSVTSLDEMGQGGENEVDLNNQTNGDKDFVSARGVRFTPTSGDRVPYGLSSVKELLKFISIIICPNEPYTNSEQIISLGLDLMTIALEVGGKHIGNFPTLVELIKDDVCKSLLALLKHERISILVSTMRVCFLMFECLRPHLKFQLESYLLKLMELIAYESPKASSYEVKELAIDNIVSLWRIPGFVTELYLNYDCDLYCSNLFEDLTKTLSKTAFPQQAIYSVHHLSLEALLAVIDSVETHCHFMMVSSKEDKDTVDKKNVRPVDQLLCPVAASGKQLANVIENSKQSGNGLVSALHQTKIDHFAPVIPNHEQVTAIRHKKRLLHQGTEHFNQKPSKGIDFLMENNILPKPFDAEKVAVFLRSNYQLDKNKIGDYISHRNNCEILQAFVKSFAFADIRIDEALRMYLETFRLPGEAQPISLILEHFAEHWHRSNNDPFASPDAAFTLAYGIIMLNVDQHNHNVKKQSTPMTEEDFIKNLKGVNAGADFDRQLLSDIYHSIRNDEIVMPAEQTGLVRDNYLWKVLLKRGASSEGKFTECPSGALDDEVFSLAWSPTLVALSYLLDKCMDDTLLIQKLMSGYRKCATIAAHYGRNEVFDHLIQALYKYTGISSADCDLGVLKSLGGDQRAQLTAKMMFTLAHKHGDVMKEGWKQVIDCAMILYRTGLMPASMTTSDDFVEPKGYVSIAKRPPVSNAKAEHGFLSSFVSYIVSSENAAQKELELQLRGVAQTCVLNFHPDFIFSESSFLQTSALEELIKVLISACPVPSSHSYVNDSGYDEESTVFALELLVKVILKNKDRLHTIWNPVRDHLFALVMGAAASEYRILLERSVVGMLRVALRLCKGDYMGSQVLQSLTMLLLLKPTTIRVVAREVVYAIHELLRTSASCLTTRSDWQTVFAVLSVAGAGLKPTSNCLAMILDNDLLAKIASACAEMKIQATDSQSYDSGVQSDSEMSLNRKSAAELDRGYTSDSEISRTPKHQQCSNNPKQNDRSSEKGNNNMTGSWILVGQEEGSPARSSINQYTISLYGCDLLPHDAFAMTKAAQCLTQLVRDSGQNLNELNIESCICCIRVFVEASLQSKTKRARAVKSNRKIANPRPPSPLSESDSDSENCRSPPEYSHIAVHLLDVMHSLHTSCSKQDQQLITCRAELWSKCWCPLLQGMARLCCDTRKPVQSAGVNYIQRALLSQTLLKAEDWEACFNQVLFPLLAALLEKDVHQDIADETRVRVNTLLCKVFLQHLSPLLTLPTFTALWLTILDYMDKYLKIQGGGEMLMDAIPECLKNMLLVMDTAGVFQTGDSYTELWNVTWDRVEAFLPGLKNELFHKPELVPKVTANLSSDMHDTLQTGVAVQAEEVESALPPVMSLEEACRITQRKTPLAIGGLLLQETPLTPNQPRNTHQESQVTHQQQQEHPTTTTTQQQQPPQHHQQQLYQQNYVSYAQQFSSLEQQQAYEQQMHLYNQQELQYQMQQQHLQQQNHSHSSYHSQVSQQNVAMVSPISSTPSSPQHHQSSLDRQLSYDQVIFHQQQQHLQQQLQQQPHMQQQPSQQYYQPAQVPVYPGQTLGHSASGAAGPQVQPVPLFYSTGVSTPQPVPSPQQTG